MTFAGLIWLIIAGYSLYLMFRRRPDRQQPSGWASQEEPASSDAPLTWPTEELIVDTVLDPVCGAYVPEEQSVTKWVGGTAYHFCGEQCAARFEELRKKAI